MRRREVVAGLGLAAAWPLTARAQQPGTLPVIGVLGSASPDQWADRLRAFREGLVEAGYVEGTNTAGRTGETTACWRSLPSSCVDPLP